MSFGADLKKCGPGIVVAATGLGAGDIVAASVAGAQYGTALLWAVLVGGLLKFVLNEGIGRWQLVTGTTLLEGWIEHLPRFINWYFLFYLILWTFMVAAAMMAGTGLAAYAIWPIFSVTTWAVIHALLALLFVLLGGYKLLERMMKFFIGIMFVCTLICAYVVTPPMADVLAGFFRPGLPENSMGLVFGIIGGVGGSVTIMSYGYWMREAGWKGAGEIRVMRTDLALAYGLTALFGVAIMLVAAGARPEVVAGNNMALAVAEQMVPVFGETGKWVFLLGFWGATFSSMIGVWHGVPYLFANFVAHFHDKPHILEDDTSISKSVAYKGYLLFLCFVPMTLLYFGRPVWIVVTYAITGAFFMPLVAVLLLYMNSAAGWLHGYVNSLLTKIILLICLLLFGFLLVQQVMAL